MDVIDELIACCEAWEPEVCVMGNVRAGEAAKALRGLRADLTMAGAFHKAAVAQRNSAWEEIEHLRAELDSMTASRKAAAAWGELWRVRCDRAVDELAVARAELAECRQKVKDVPDQLRRAFNLGQTYLQQADSESYVQNKKSEATLAAFNTLISRSAPAESA